MRAAAGLLAGVLLVSSCTADVDEVEPVVEPAPAEEETPQDPPPEPEPEPDPPEPEPLAAAFDFDPIPTGDEVDADVDEGELALPLEPTEDDVDLESDVPGDDVDDEDLDDGTPVPDDVETPLFDPCTLLDESDWASWVAGEVGASQVVLEDGEACGYTDEHDTLRLAIGWFPTDPSEERYVPTDDRDLVAEMVMVGAWHALWMPAYPVDRSSTLVVEHHSGDLVVEMSSRGDVHDVALLDGARSFAEIGLLRVEDELTRVRASSQASPRMVPAGRGGGPPSDWSRSAQAPERAEAAQAGSSFVTRYVRRPRSTRLRSGACVSSTTIELREFGISGVTRFRAKFGLHSPHGPIPYQSSIWRYSVSFPDDYRNLGWRTGWSFRHPSGGVYAIRVKAIGIRPGLWNRDYVIKANLSPRVGCERFSEPGPQDRVGGMGGA